MTVLAIAFVTSGTSAAAQPPAWIAKMDSVRPRFSAADVEFMQGMIHHHAQPILMAGWAPTHDAGPAIRELCERIVVAQRDEIVFMQRWLREHNQDVPDADTAHFLMPGMESMLMSGMLTADQLEVLAASRGKDFDRRFLERPVERALLARPARRGGQRTGTTATSTARRSRAGWTFWSSCRVHG